jgi:hypothetical protein
MLEAMDGENRHESASRLPEDVWRRARINHRNRVAKWTADRVERASRGIRHPVYDFLFEYYSFRPAYLARWSPGANVVLGGADPAQTDWPADFVSVDGGACIPARTFPRHRFPYLSWAAMYLARIAERPASFCCFGLHEWAMVYRVDRPRHEQVPLRLSPSAIAEVVEASDLRCTHFDAFRYFTPDAAPRNRHALRRDTTTDFDQRGCVHVTMDLYKFAHKIAPWCGSELIADAFLLAAEARKVDMRASPYDLADAGFSPIRIETVQGREEYVTEQRRLAELAVPVRQRLLQTYRRLLRDIEREDGRSGDEGASFLETSEL